MTDSEIFYWNVKRICKEKKMKIGRVDVKAGYSVKYAYQLAYKHCAVSVEHIRQYAKALEVEPMRLMKGMF